MKSVCMNRCTLVENPGKGVAQVFTKIPRGGGGSRLSGKISGFIAFLLTSILKFAWGVGSYIYPPPSPLTPLCASMCVWIHYYIFTDCPNGFVHLNNKCYRTISPNTIDEQLKACHLYRGKLLTVSSSNPLSEMIAKYLMNLYSVDTLYAGNWLIKH